MCRGLNTEITSSEAFFALSVNYENFLFSPFSTRFDCKSDQVECRVVPIQWLSSERGDAINIPVWRNISGKEQKRPVCSEYNPKKTPFLLIIGVMFGHEI